MSVKTIALLILSFDVIAIGRGPLRPVVSPDIASGRRVSHTADEGTDAGEAAGQQIEYKGTYVNKKYGFSVTIPDHLVGKGTVPPAPNHGFEVAFSKEQDDSIGVFAFYTVVGEGPTPPHSPTGRSPECGATVAPATLAGLPAELRISRIAHGGKQGTRVCEKLSAHRESSGEKIDYTVLLMTREPFLPEREKVFRQMVASFKLLPVR